MSGFREIGRRERHTDGFALLTGHADCHYSCLTSRPSDVPTTAYFNNISCCQRKTEHLRGKKENCVAVENQAHYLIGAHVQNFGINTTGY